MSFTSNGCPAQVPESEKALIGIMSLGPDHVPRVCDRVGPADFYIDDLASSFNAIRDRVFEVGGQCGLPELAEHVENWPILIECVEQVTSLDAEHLDYHASRVVEASDRRRFRQQLLEAEKLAASTPVNELGELIRFAPRSNRKRNPAMADVEETRVDWLWKNWLPRRKLVLFGGDEGIGKGMLLSALAATVTTGGRFPDGSTCRPGNVLMLSPEDDISDTLRPRLRVNGADLTRVKAIDYHRDGIMQLPDQIVELERELREWRPALTMIEPLDQYLGKRDGNSNAEMRELLGQVKRLAEQYDTSIVLGQHTSKDTKRHGLTRFLGSKAYTAFCRLVLGLVRDPDDPRRRIFAEMKNNLADDLMPGWAFELESVEGEQVPRVLWDSKPVNVDGRNLFQPGEGNDDGPKRRANKADDGAAFIRSMLADGPVDSNEVRARCEAQGIKGGTYDRARKLAKVTSIKLADRWCTQLTEVDPNDEVATF